VLKTVGLSLSAGVACVTKQRLIDVSLIVTTTRTLEARVSGRIHHDGRRKGVWERVKVVGYGESDSGWCELVD
jgi:hypothetical protein